MSELSILKDKLRNTKERKRLIEVEIECLKAEIARLEARERYNKSTTRT